MRHAFRNAYSKNHLHKSISVYKSDHFLNVQEFIVLRKVMHLEVFAGNIGYSVSCFSQLCTFLSKYC